MNRFSRYASTSGANPKEMYHNASGMDEIIQLDRAYPPDIDVHMIAIDFDIHLRDEPDWLVYGVAASIIRTEGGFVGIGQRQHL